MRYQIEIANRIERGRTVGTDYVVTQRPIGNTAILARFVERADAEQWIAAQPHTRDEDCTVGGNGCCTVCGVAHGTGGEPACACGGRGFHRDGCVESDATRIRWTDTDDMDISNNSDECTARELIDALTEHYSAEEVAAARVAVGALPVGGSCTIRGGDGAETLVERLP